MPREPESHDTGSSEKEAPWHRILSAGSSLQDPLCRILSAGSSLQDPLCRILSAVPHAGRS